MRVYNLGMRSDGPQTNRRLPRTQRREHILAAATEAFALKGFAGTGLEDIAAAANVSRVILYRHFDSKADLYRAALVRARQRLSDAAGPPDYTEQIIDSLVAAAGSDPSAFRLLFHHAAREPQFREEFDLYQAEMTKVAGQQIAGMIPDPAWAQWAALLVPTATVSAITAWLDAGQPDPTIAANRIKQAVGGIIDAARLPPTG